MKKSEALAQFGGAGTPEAARIQAMAEFFGITRHAIYMWPEDGIPELRALQLQQRAVEQALSHLPQPMRQPQQ